MLKYNHPVLAYILAHWTITLLLPSLIVLVVTLALITRWWDQKDERSNPSNPVAEQTPQASGVAAQP